YRVFHDALKPRYEKRCPSGGAAKKFDGVVAFVSSFPAIAHRAEPEGRGLSFPQSSSSLSLLQEIRDRRYHPHLLVHLLFRPLIGDFHRRQNLEHALIGRLDGPDFGA